MPSIRQRGLDLFFILFRTVESCSPNRGGRRLSANRMQSKQIIACRFRFSRGNSRTRGRVPGRFPDFLFIFIFIPSAVYDFSLGPKYRRVKSDQRVGFFSQILFISSSRIRVKCLGDMLRRATVSTGATGCYRESRQPDRASIAPLTNASSLTLLGRCVCGRRITQRAENKERPGIVNTVHASGTRRDTPYLWLVQVRLFISIKTCTNESLSRSNDRESFGESRRPCFGWPGVQTAQESKVH